MSTAIPHTAAILTDLLSSKQRATNPHYTHAHTHTGKGRRDTGTDNKNEGPEYSPCTRGRAREEDLFSHIPAHDAPDGNRGNGKRRPCREERAMPTQGETCL